MLGDSGVISFLALGGPPVVSGIRFPPRSRSLLPGDGFVLGRVDGTENGRRDESMKKGRQGWFGPGPDFSQVFF